MLNVAVTILFDVMVVWQLPVPMQSPLKTAAVVQPEGAAITSTTVPFG